MKGTWTPAALALFLSCVMQVARPVLAAIWRTAFEGVEPFARLDGVVVDRSGWGVILAVAAVGLNIP